MPQNTPKTCLYRYQNRNPIDFTYIDLLPLFPFAIIIKYMKITSKIYTVNLILCYGYFFIFRFQVKNIFENSLNISFSFHKIIFFSEHSLRFWLSCVCVCGKRIGTASRFYYVWLFTVILVLKVLELCPISRLFLHSIFFWYNI